MATTVWRNLPLPEPHLVGLGAAAALQLLSPWPIGLPGWCRLGGALPVAAGVALVAWAVRAAVGARLDRSDRLVVGGPYARSRNPMYVGWTLVYLGVALAVASWWMVLLAPGVLIATHLTVVREERRLRRLFAEEYGRYASAVRRYV